MEQKSRVAAHRARLPPTALLAALLSAAAGCYHHDPVVHAVAEAPRAAPAQREGRYRSLGPKARATVRVVERPKGRTISAVVSGPEAARWELELSEDSDGRPLSGSARLALAGVERRVGARVVEGGALALWVDGVTGRLAWGPASRLDPGHPLVTALWLSAQREGSVRVVGLAPARPEGRFVAHWRVSRRRDDGGRSIVVARGGRERIVVWTGALFPIRVERHRPAGGRWAVVEAWSLTDSG